MRSSNGFLKQGYFIRTPEKSQVFWGSLDLQAPKSNTDAHTGVHTGVGTMGFFSGKCEFQPASQMQSSTVEEFLKTLPEGQGSLFTTADFEEPHKNLFEKSFQDIQGRIFRAEIEKAVPIVFSRSSKLPDEATLVDWIARVLQTPTSLWAFGVWDEHGGIIGATPELLFRRQGKKVQSMALAGTLTKDKSPQELWHSRKDRHEHTLVVQDIRQKLEKFGWVKINETQVVELPTLFHLRTLIEADNVTVTSEEMMQAMHPTAALGVFPKNYGIAWMKQLPYQEERGQFGGPILFRLPEEDIVLVAIRCVQWQSSPAGTQIGAGCGLVKTSEFSQEWNEVLAKIHSIKKILGLT